MPDSNHQATPSLISSAGIFKGRVVDLSIDRVMLPNGHETELEMIRHPGAAVALPLDTDEGGADHVVLVRQYRHAADGWLLEVPGGKLDGAEDPEVCARRELEEEIGLTAGELTGLGSILTTPGFTDERIWIYIARDLTPIEGGRSPEPNEVIEVERIPFSQAVAMAATGEIVDAKTVAALLRAAFHLGAGPPAA
ncbi:MAG TPA: NUDIX hydrolase [Acidimicrobiia bacterium]|nr:NUDIX hydrolase [Acidimicrobiia bacterium]